MAEPCGQSDIGHLAQALQIPEHVSGMQGAITITAKDSSDAGMRLAVMAKEVRAGSRLSIVGMIIMAGVLVFVQHMFGDKVRPSWLLALWIGSMAGVIFYWVAAMVMFHRRQPDDHDTVHYWTRLGAHAQTGLNIGIACTPWLLMSAADPQLQSLMTLLYLWYVATGIMTANAGVPVPAWEVMMLTASSAGFALWQGAPYSGWIALFLVLIGLTLLGLRTLVRSSVLAAFEAQLASARSESAMQDALALVAAQRDAKTRMIAAASHDLQQPAQAASLYFELALSQHGAARDAAIGGARAAFSAIGGLLESMLDYLQLDAGAVTARLEPIAVGPVLAAAMQQHRPAADTAGLALRASPTTAVVMADASLLHRALGNLIANAIRHSGARRLQLAARRRGTMVEIWAIDDGKGVADADTARLFDDFAQGSGASAGFGLGLASVRRQLALMGGKAQFEPRWRRGAAFMIGLPAGGALPPFSIAAE
ncbi:HAMP domain-containing sensor histidine kinase [Sandarakinorhabdus sp.]|uniref:sensor histidine kinase n=1 Tax=Sandarakinorhabdus sp. TaxID=1916663 RepID=UPI00286E9641|nr:HAMP domain-containing sensor histidine kinase [Sandarakinorhabdus sp.]